MDPSLRPFFAPVSIVVIGVSTSSEKLGYGVARNLVQSGYQGSIHFVGHRRGELFGRPLHAYLSEVPQPVDLAIVLVPPEVAPGIIEECGRGGIRAAIIMSSGFREVGPQGAVLEEQCLQAARAHEVRLLGPNCIGIINTHLPLDTSFLQPPMPARGRIGFISQSGAFCAAVIDWSRNEGFGFSQLISLGNQVDVNETDALAALAEDEVTRVTVLYLEGISDGRRFVKAARDITRRKPVIAIKAGRSASGQKAAASHTGALVGSGTAFEAAFEKAGILQAGTTEQMFDWARAMEHCPLPKGRRIAILTNAGGPGVLAADALEQNGLQLANLEESTREALAAHLPKAANPHNPVDMLASASPELYACCLKILLDDPQVEGVIVILPPPPMFRAEDVAAEIVHVLESGKPPSPAEKPVVVALMGSTLVADARAIFHRSHIPTYPFPERAASALAALAQRAEYLSAEPWNDADPQGSPGRHDRAADFLLEKLLAEYGVETASVERAPSMKESVRIAGDLGYPVVMKIASPDILHKSDVGGVVLNIGDAAALQIAYTQMIERVKTARPDARIQGVSIQRQLPLGQDVIVGAVRDAQFGPLLMFGSGGLEVEGLKDVSFALAPLSPAEAEKMVRRTWAGRKLKGFRDLAPVDEHTVVDVLIRVSRLMMEQEWVEEIEINPLRVFARGAVAVDVRGR
jgi:acetate---CoA ligase (ADP-forming)